jgi:hypothetical protein
MTPADRALIAEARGWLSDCEWEDMTPARIRRLSADAVRRAVARHYDGGWAAFAAASG